MVKSAKSDGIVKQFLILATLIILMLTLVIACTSVDPIEEVTEAPPPGDVLLDAEDVTAEPVTLVAVLPSEVPGGNAPTVSLSDAASFSWQEFIALNWPAAVDENGNIIRDTASSSLLFGQHGEGDIHPTVWETYRGKVEIFGSRTDPPPAYVAAATAVAEGTTVANYGYNSTPVYQYSNQVTYDPVTYARCEDSPYTGSTTPWVNLDEDNQIKLDDMYVGIVPDSSTANPNPTLIRYVAKANSTEYDYISTLRVNEVDVAATANAFAGSVGAGNNPSLTDGFYLPVGTIEAKAAWRVLTSEERSIYEMMLAGDPVPAGTVFPHISIVRYYKTNDEGETCSVDEAMALIALHIIQKTPSAPYFIFASFEYNTNILDVAGNPVENAAGAPLSADNASTPAFEPQPTYQELSTADPTSLPTPANVSIGDQTYCTEPGSRLYYHNTVQRPDIPAGGFICINRRAHDIPIDVQSVNAEYQGMINTYNVQNNITTSPWANYRLVNVQAVPLNLSDLSSNSSGADPSQVNPSTYFMANIVVEDNYTLQFFRGRQTQGGAASAFNPSGIPFNNIYTDIDGTPTRFNMGGCMGCHGNAQAAGYDFSFIALEAYNEGAYPEPEIPATATISVTFTPTPEPSSTPAP